MLDSDMNLLQELLLICGLFYLHHLVRWQMRRGHYALAKLNKLVQSQSLDEIEILAGHLSRHPHCSSTIRATALRCRAWSRICRGRLREARNDVAQALEWDPRDGRTYLVKAMVDWQTNPEDALRSLDRTRQYRPFWGRRAFDQAVAKFRGLALVQLGRGEEALLQFAALPSNQDLTMQRQTAQALALAGRYQESLMCFQTVGEKDPRLALGRYLLDAKRPQESLFWLNRTLSEQPTAMALFLKAEALFHSGDESESSRCLEEWMAILMRPADYPLYPEMTEFGRLHLSGRPATRVHCN